MMVFLSIQQTANVWIHNVDLYYGKAGGDADQAKGDGSIDIKGNSQYITVSYVHFMTQVSALYVE